MSATIDPRPRNGALQGEASTFAWQGRQPSLGVQRESLLAELLTSWKTGAGTAGRTLVSELEALSSHIRDLRAEIAAVSLAELQKKIIPTATDQLEAVVEMTERATHKIIEAADSIEAAIHAVDESWKSKFREATTTLYEACNFQDITGQHVAKVVSVLKEIEAEINALLAIFEGRSVSMEPISAQGRCGPHGRHELLEGPQLCGHGNSQSDIDAFFAADCGSQDSARDSLPASRPSAAQRSSRGAWG